MMETTSTNGQGISASTWSRVFLHVYMRDRTHAAIPFLFPIFMRLTAAINNIHISVTLELLSHMPVFIASTSLLISIATAAVCE